MSLGTIKPVDVLNVAPIPLEIDTASELIGKPVDVNRGTDSIVLILTVLSILNVEVVVLVGIVELADEGFARELVLTDGVPDVVMLGILEDPDVEDMIEVLVRL